MRAETHLITLSLLSVLYSFFGIFETVLKMNLTKGIQRKAIGATGRVGSFYDGCKECILVQQVKVKTKEDLQQSSAYCEIIKGDTEKSRNILKIVDIEKDLRINILLSP